MKKLEIAVLNWIKEKYNEPSLSRQIEVLVPVSYKYTKVGSFTYFEIPLSLPKLNSKTFSESPIDGPYIRSTGIEYDGGSLLFFDDGYISCLELFANGNRFDETIETFELYET